MYCRRCQYALAYCEEARCPECGTTFDPHDPETFLSNRASRFGRRAWMGAILAWVAFWVVAQVVHVLAFGGLDRLSRRAPGFGSDIMLFLHVVLNALLSAVLFLPLGALLIAITAAVLRRTRPKRLVDPSAPIVRATPLEPATWTCQWCEAPVDEEFQRCWQCGAARDGMPDDGFQPAVVSAETPRCRQCGTVRSTGTSGPCAICGGEDVDFAAETILEPPSDRDRRVDRVRRQWLLGFAASWAALFCTGVMGCSMTVRDFLPRDALQHFAIASVFAIGVTGLGLLASMFRPDAS